MANDKNTDLRTPIGRGAFLKLFRARQDDPSKKPTYEATLITAPIATMSPKDKEALKALQTAAKAAMRAEHGDAAFTSEGKIADGYDWPFKDAGTKSEFEGFEKGRVCFSMNTVLKVGVADATRGKNSEGHYPEAEEEDIYSGAFYMCTVEPYAYKPSKGKPRKGVKLTLRSVIKVADGERFDGKVAAGAQFADLSDDDFKFEDTGKVTKEQAKSGAAAGGATSGDDEIDL